jgi:hypothetical protein
MEKKMETTKRPRDVKNVNDFVHMESDNHPQVHKVWSILHSGEHVSLHAPDGEGWVQIPTAQFNKLVDWYMAPQKLSKAKTDAQP